MSDLINPFAAARSGDITLLSLYFDRGGDPDQQDADRFTALHFACNGGHQHVVKLLLAHRANVDARSHFQSTPLHFACEQGFDDIVRLLLANGASVDARNSDHATPLHFACQKGHTDAVETLLGASAQINPQSNKGNTPLHYACFFGRHSCVKLLLRKGADVTLENDSGKCPGRQFYSKVSRETRRLVGDLLSPGTSGEIPLRNERMSSAALASALLDQDEDVIEGDSSVDDEEGKSSEEGLPTIQGLQRLVRQLRRQASEMKANLADKDAEICKLRRRLETVEVRS